MGTKIGQRELLCLFKRNPLIQEVRGSNIGRHNNDGVLERCGESSTICQPRVIEELEHKVEDIGVGLLYLVKEHHTVGVSTRKVGKDPSLLIPFISRGRSDKLGDRVLLHVLRHIEP